MAEAVKHKGFKWTVGDASNPTLALLVDDVSKSLHIAEAADSATDWNVSAATHPSVYIHSATAPATTYMLMFNDGTDAHLNVLSANLDIDVPSAAQVCVQVNNTDEYTFNATELLLAAANKLALRSTSTYIQSGAAGKMTLSASGAGSDDITLSGTVTLVDHITVPTAKSIRGASGDNKTASIAVGSGTGTAFQDIIKVSSATVLAKKELGFFNTTPAAQPAATAQVATGTAAAASTNATAINTILSNLATLGLKAST